MSILYVCLSIGIFCAFVYFRVNAWASFCAVADTSTAIYVVFLSEEARVPRETLHTWPSDHKPSMPRIFPRAIVVRVQSINRWASWTAVCILFWRNFKISTSNICNGFYGQFVDATLSTSWWRWIWNNVGTDSQLILLCFGKIAKY